MKYRFFNTLDKSELLSQKADGICPFLIQHNQVQIEKIYNFYQNNDINLLYVNGFQGTGKADIVKYSLNFLQQDVLVFRYNCFNSTVLDDILLSLFRDFKSLVAQNVIFEPKVKSENFAQKVNSFFSLVDKPCLVVIDSFEAVLEENRQEIVDFIHHLYSLAKVKVIIIGRTFVGEAFADTKIERVITLAFDKALFEKYLRTEKVKTSNVLIDELYKFTRGYYLFTAFSALIMKNKNISLLEFLSRLKDSFLSFDKFLSKEILTLVPSDAKNLFCFLSVIRHPISIDLLKKTDFFNEDNIKFLMSNLIILHDDKNVYVQDYLKDESEEFVAQGTLQKIRNYIIELYQSQLPLKPLERDIPISRQTMRKEIEFHKLFLPKHNTSYESLPVDVNYMSYVRQFNKNEKADTTSQEEKKTDSGIDLTKRKNVSLNLNNLPVNKPFVSNNEDAKKVLVSFSQIIDFIKKADKAYQYSDVIELALKAVSMKTDPTYQQLLPFLYAKLAKAYSKLAKSDKAIEYYGLLLNSFEEKGDLSKAFGVKFTLAMIYYDSYNFEKAKSLFKEIVESPHSAKIAVVKSYLRLATIEEDVSGAQGALAYYKSAFNYVDLISDDAVLAELYFKYALIMDDTNNSDAAAEYYIKCLKVTDNPDFNNFLSPAYSNLATIYFEKNDLEKSADFYAKAYDIDLQKNNWEGVYDSALKLSSLLKNSSRPLAVKYFQSALDAAKNMKDVFYIISSLLAFGDFYYDDKKDEFALKYYLKAFDLAKNNLSDENIYKIQVRLNDLKFRLGTDKFNTLSEMIDEKDLD